MLSNRILAQQAHTIKFRSKKKRSEKNRRKGHTIDFIIKWGIFFVTDVLFLACLTRINNIQFELSFGTRKDNRNRVVIIMWTTFVRSTLTSIRLAFHSNNLFVSCCYLKELGYSRTKYFISFSGERVGALRTRTKQNFFWLSLRQRIEQNIMK